MLHFSTIYSLTFNYFHLSLKIANTPNYNIHQNTSFDTGIKICRKIVPQTITYNNPNLLAFQQRLILLDWQAQHSSQFDQTHWAATTFDKLSTFGLGQVTLFKWGKIWENWALSADLDGHLNPLPLCFVKSITFNSLQRYGSNPQIRFSAL